MKKNNLLALAAFLFLSIGHISAQVQLIFPYEAENLTLTGGPVVKAATNASNAKVVSDFSSLNASLNCDTINGGTSTGTATLTIRYANGNSNNRSLSLSVNGSFVKQVSFAPTVDWNTYADISVSFTLNSGKANTILLQRTATDVAGVDIDSYTVTLKNPSSTDNFNLVWADEFNGSGVPDPTKWGYEEGYIRNNELQYYTKSTDNVKQNAGNLEITVKRESTPIGGKNYSSGSVVTRNTASWTYGKIEGRFKMPSSTSLWPCFWTLGVNENPIGWPKCGEIDIFEHIDTETYIHSTAHWANAQGNRVSSGASSASIDFTQYHNYTIEWTPTQIRWYVDGVRHHALTITNGISNTFAFHLPQFILINLPLGGSWPKAPDATTVLPSTMYCDYIRVYEWVPATTLPITYFALNPTTLSVPKGKNLQIKSTIIPANATNKTMNWQSSDNTIATVDASGVVTGVASGSATITATSTDGSNKTSTCAITVFDPYSYNFILNPGFELNNAASQTALNWAEWSPNNPSSVDKGQVVTGDAHSGSYFAKMTHTAPYATMFFQTVNNIPVGTYNLKGWFRSSGGQDWSAMSIKNYGGSEIFKPLNTAMSSWTELSSNNINITTGICEIDIYNSALANQWIDFDDISLMLAPPTGVKSTNESNHISIFPNMITNNVLNISNTSLAKCEISITNLNGQVLFSNHFNTGNSNINTSFLKTGIYLVKVNNGTDNFIHKIIIQ
jgi:beta-glucanase (GH16 family)